MKKTLIALVLAAGLLCLMGAGSVSAVTFSLPAGAKEAGGNPVSASADFTLDSVNDKITIKVWNTLVDPKTVAQNISDLRFDLSTGQNTGTLTSSSGLERNVAADGTWSDPNTGGHVATGWVLQTDGTGLKLNGLGSAANVPAHTILGLPAGDNVYGNANSSIAGNVPHNPFLFGTAADPVTFVLSVPGIDGTTAVIPESVVFSFGTAAGNNVGVVPLPGALLLLGAGLARLAAYGRRRRNEL